MMIAIPEDEWCVFSRMRPAEMVATLRELAQKVCLKGYRKSLRGPKKPRLKREGTTKVSHVSTAELLRNLKVNAATLNRAGIKNLMETIARLTGFTGKIVWDTTKPNGQPRRQLDTNRAREFFGFRANTELETGLACTVAWYREQIARTLSNS